MANVDFINEIKPYALKTEKNTGIPSAIMIAQACLETGFGENFCIDINTRKNSKNLFNIKGNGTNGNVWVWTTEYYSGVKTKVKAKFRAYNSYEDSFIDYANLINRLYKRCLIYKNNPEKFAYKLVSEPPKYATDPNYPQKLINIMKIYGLLNLKEDIKVKKEDADKIIALLGGLYNFVKSQEDKDEIHRLADELRKASGEKVS